MAKHTLVLTPRKQMTEAVEPPAKRRQAIAEQVVAYLAGGGQIEKIPTGHTDMDPLATREQLALRTYAARGRSSSRGNGGER